VAKLYGMLHPNAGRDVVGPHRRRQRDGRTVFIIGPDKKVKAHLAYPMSTGRNFDEILRMIDSIQLTAKHKVATPVNWKRGEDVVIVPAVSEAEARERFPKGWKAPKPYLRIVPEPVDA
jgi:alkyl hydroperoxide reductase subunit AhpC